MKFILFINENLKCKYIFTIFKDAFELTIFCSEHVANDILGNDFLELVAIIVLSTLVTGESSFP